MSTKIFKVFLLFLVYPNPIKVIENETNPKVNLYLIKHC